jgi:hypothetical protein
MLNVEENTIPEEIMEQKTTMEKRTDCSGKAYK